MEDHQQERRTQTTYQGIRRIATQGKENKRGTSGREPTHEQTSQIIHQGTVYMVVGQHHCPLMIHLFELDHF